MTPAAEAVLVRLRCDVAAAERDLEEARAELARENDANRPGGAWLTTMGRRARGVAVRTAVRAAERALDRARERLAGASLLVTPAPIAAAQAALERAERDAVAQALTAHGNSRLRAAQALGWGLRTLKRYLAAHPDLAAAHPPAKPVPPQLRRGATRH